MSSASSSAVAEVGHHVVAARVGVGAELLLLLAMQRGLAQAVERAVLGGGHQPGARVVGDAVARPVLQRGDQRVLRQLLGQADVAHAAGERADDARRLDAPDGLDGAMQVTRHGAVTSVGGHARITALAAAGRAGCCPVRRPLGDLRRQERLEVLGREDGRISMSLSPTCGLGQRRTHSMASSIERTCHSQKPAIELLGLGERAVGDGARVPEKCTRTPLDDGLQAVGGQQDAGLDQLLVVLAHGLEQLGRGHHARFGTLVRLDDDHDSHSVLQVVGRQRRIEEFASCLHDARRGHFRHRRTRG